MASTTDIKKGLCIKFNNDIYKIIEFLHVKPGKGPAFIRTKLKSLTTRRILENTFPSGHKIEKVHVESHLYQYLYKEESGFHFMNTENYNQVYLPKNLINNSEFLKEGENVMITFHVNDEIIPLSIEMPANIILEVIYTEPGVKGDSTTNPTKLAILETGVKVQVPLFINKGDCIKVNVENGLYIERAK